MYYAFTGYWIGTFSLFPSSSSSFLRLFFFLQFSPGCVTFCPLLLSENPLRKMPLIANAALGSFSIYSSSFEPFFFFFFFNQIKFFFSLSKWQRCPLCPSRLQHCVSNAKFCVLPYEPFLHGSSRPLCWQRCSLNEDITVARHYFSIGKGRQLLKCTMMDLKWLWNGLDLIQLIRHQGKRILDIII